MPEGIIERETGILFLGDQMKKRTITYILFLVIPLAVGGVTGMMVYHGMPTYQQLEKPSFTPPDVLFSLVWNLLYLLMGVGAARVWLTQKPERQKCLLPFALQLMVNFFWSVWFFGPGWYLLAFLWLLLLLWLILWMMASFARVDLLAARLQIPYLLWTGYAAVLNFGVFLLNQ